MKEPITTPDAPQAIGPYSQAIRTGGMVYCSGQVALDPGTGTLVAGDVTDETRQVLKNLGAVLAASGSSFDEVVKTTVYLTDLDDFAAMNQVYAEFLGNRSPARATVEVSALPLGARVEIEAIALASGATR